MAHNPLIAYHDYLCARVNVDILRNNEAASAAFQRKLDMIDDLLWSSSEPVDEDYEIWWF